MPKKEIDRSEDKQHASQNGIVKLKLMNLLLRLVKVDPNKLQLFWIRQAMRSRGLMKAQCGSELR